MDLYGRACTRSDVLRRIIRVSKVFQEWPHGGIATEIARTSDPDTGDAVLAMRIFECVRSMR